MVNRTCRSTWWLHPVPASCCFSTFSIAESVHMSILGSHFHGHKYKDWVNIVTHLSVICSVWAPDFCSSCLYGDITQDLPTIAFWNFISGLNLNKCFHSISASPWILEIISGLALNTWVSSPGLLRAVLISLAHCLLWLTLGNCSLLNALSSMAQNVLWLEGLCMTTIPAGLLRSKWAKTILSRVPLPVVLWGDQWVRDVHADELVGLLQWAYWVYKGTVKRWIEGGIFIESWNC